MINLLTGFRNFLASIIIVAAFAVNAGAQVVVEKSKDKVIISGVPYYIHLVKKGETAYSISKAYNITVEELNKENPPAVYGLKEGQALRLPVREAPAAQTPQPKPVQQPRDESRYQYHHLQPGQTVYSLSKLYGVSEDEIIAANPGIEISRLPVNAEIAIPRREFMTEKQEFAVQDSKYIFHRVESGESLASIADHYGITIRELRRENRDIRFPQVGDYLRIPATAKTAAVEQAEQPPADTVSVPVRDTVIVIPRPEGYTSVSNLKGKINIAVLLPFYLSENAIRSDIDSSKWVRGQRVYKPVRRQDDWIYYMSTPFIEMYQGILLAVDTLRALGMGVNLYTYDIKSDTLALTRLINRGQLAGMDLIIGPVYSRNLAIVAEYGRKMNIPVVSPVRLMNNSALQNNPLLFLANSSLNVAQDAIAEEISDYYLDNFVFIHADTAGVDPEVKRFRNRIISELSSRIPFQEIKFKELMFYSRSAFNNDSINRLGHALSAKSENIIIIASEEDPVISETLQEIHSLSKKFPVRVFGYPSLRGIENLEPKFIFELDLLVFSPYWIDYSANDVKQFNSDFRNKFQTEPSEMSYAWLGYDITYYFLSGLAIFGTDFLEHPEIHNPDLLHTEFDFRRSSNDDGFENRKLYRVRYTKNYEVILESVDYHATNE
ncbi:MAG TPA: LysM peptidoglycan-binding domain-containing protein [Bacteroidales bacterium]|nr:LysM peptidoglycan-binding domain-containing protein [Bacteroidales bacterium]